MSGPITPEDVDEVLDATVSVATTLLKDEDLSQFLHVVKPLATLGIGELVSTRLSAKSGKLVREDSG